MTKTSRIDSFFEVPIMWAATGRICEDVYFALRHYCLRILGALSPQWLPFVRQAEKKLKPYQKHLRPQYTWLERSGFGLRRPLGILLLPVVVTPVLASIFDLPLLVRVPDASSVLTGILKTTGSILATLTGILLAVTALAIQTTLANLPGVRFLVGPFARRQRFIPVAAFLFGTLMNIIAGIVLADVWRLQTLNDWVVLTSVTACAAILLLFDLLRRTLQKLGQTKVADLLRTVLTNDWRVYTHATFRQILIEIYLRRELAKLGFRRHVCSESKEGKQTGFHLKRTGYVAHVDMVPLRRIASLLRIAPVRPILELQYPVFSGTRYSDSPCVTIPEDGNIAHEKSLALILPMQSNETAKDDVGRIDRLVQCAFIVGRSHATDFNWQTLYSVMMQAVEQRDVMLTKAGLDAFQAILEEHNSVFRRFLEQLKARDVTPPDAFSLNYAYHFSPPHPAELSLADLAIRASRNNSGDCLDEILNAIYSLVCMCFKTNELNSLRDMLFELYWSYQRSDAISDGNGPSVAAAVMRRLPWVAKEADHCLFEHKDSLGRLEKVRGFSIPYYSLCLHLLRCSCERCDKKMFDRVLEDLRNFLKHVIPSDVKWLREGRDRNGSYPGIEHGLYNRAPQEQQEFVDLWNDLHDYRNLVYVISGAWLVHQVGAGRLESEKAAPFLTKLIDATAAFRDLLDLYAIPGMGGMTSGPENPLGFSTWDWPYSPYPNARWGTDFQRWIEPFYAFLLFKRAAQNMPRTVTLDLIHSTAEADHDSLKSFLETISAEQYTLSLEFENSSWGMNADGISAAKKRIRQLLASWSLEETAADEQPNAPSSSE